MNKKKYPHPAVWNKYKGSYIKGAPAGINSADVNKIINRPEKDTVFIGIIPKGDKLKVAAQNWFKDIFLINIIVKSIQDNHVKINYKNSNKLWEQTYKASLNEGKLWFKPIDKKTLIHETPIIHEKKELKTTAQNSLENKYGVILNLRVDSTFGKYIRVHFEHSGKLWEQTFEASYSQYWTMHLDTVGEKEFICELS